MLKSIDGFYFVHCCATLWHSGGSSKAARQGNKQCLLQIHIVVLYLERQKIKILHHLCVLGHSGRLLTVHKS